MVTEKICVQCEELQPAEAFYVYKYKNRNPVLYARCKICLSKHKGTKWYRLDPDSVEHRERKLKQKREEYHRIKGKVFIAYGNACACCGETIPEFLTIDHINNNGAVHRKEVGGNTGVLRDIIKNNYPNDYQILCWNCNCSKQFSGGCPHTKEHNESN